MKKRILALLLALLFVFSTFVALFICLLWARVKNSLCLKPILKKSASSGLQMGKANFK